MVKAYSKSDIGTGCVGASRYEVVVSPLMPWDSFYSESEGSPIYPFSGHESGGDPICE